MGWIGLGLLMAQAFAQAFSPMSTQEYLVPGLWFLLPLAIFIYGIKLLLSKQDSIQKPSP